MVWYGMVWCYGMVWYGINNIHLGKLLVRLVKAVHLCLKFMHLLETMGRLGGGQRVNTVSKNSLRSNWF